MRKQHFLPSVESSLCKRAASLLTNKRARRGRHPHWPKLKGGDSFSVSPAQDQRQANSDNPYRGPHTEDGTPSHLNQRALVARLTDISNDDISRVEADVNAPDLF